MKKDTFLKRFKKRGKTIVNFLSTEQIEKQYGFQYNAEKVFCQNTERKFYYDNFWSRYELNRKLRRLKMLTKFMNFKCDFNSKGKCQGLKDKSLWTAPKCCCGDCTISMGYFEFIPERMIEYYADLFDYRNGFWSSETGCKIESHADRSQVCLTYSCHPDENFHSGMNEFGNILRKIEYDIVECQHAEYRQRRKDLLKKDLT